jgi:signal transduction histidine kinase
VRLLVIALAAWWGSRWLARPVERLSKAAEALGENAAGTPPRLDESTGTREVREAARVFNTMTRRLKRQFSERSLLVAALSHDLRTPLTRLRMRLESMELPPEARQRSVSDIGEMNALINSALELFRSDFAGDQEPRQATDVCALLQALVDDLSEQGRAVTFSGEAAVARVQALALRRVFGNLIANALRYGQRADLLLQAGPDALQVFIDDAGPGIPPDQLEAVFQPFYRLESSRSRSTGGTGLGLYIARELVQAQGGSLTLSNRAEGGLRATVRIPR